MGEWAQSLFGRLDEERRSHGRSVRGLPCS
jgi:hypothetical protein